MSAGRTPVAGLLLAIVAVALAGCSSPPPAEPAPVAPVEEGPQGGLLSSKDLGNVSQPDEQSEFAKSLDEKFHTHNYWGNSMEKLLMDADVKSGPFAPSWFGDITAYFFNVALSKGFGTAVFSLPEGFVVPPEAERLEITVSYTASPTITGMYLSYHTAADPPDVFTDLEPLPEGDTTIPLPTTLAQNDIPHTTISKWLFKLVPYNSQVPTAPGLFNGSAHVTIKAFRPDVLFVAPPHPDFWGTNTTRDIFVQEGRLKGERLLFPLLIPGAQNGFEFIRPPEGTIVPPHTGLLTVVLNWTNEGGLPEPFGGGLEMLYRPPSTFQFLPGDVATATDGTATFTIPVDTAMWDSPYANRSEWYFLLLYDTGAPTDQGTFFGDVGFFDGPYRIAVTAEREVV